MKLIASLVVAASLVLGVITASTSYVVSLDLPDELLLADDAGNQLTLNAPYGVIPKGQLSNQLIGRAGMRLRRLDDFNASVERAVEQALSEGFERDELRQPDPPADAYRQSLIDQGQLYELAMYDALVAAGIRPSTIRTEQQTRLVESAPLAPVAIWQKGTRIDAGTLEAMRAFRDASEGTDWQRDVITVKQFDFARWQHRWWFVLSVIGLIAGAAGLRIASRAAIRAHESAMSRTSASNPRASLEAATASLVALRDGAVGETDDARRAKAIIEGIDRVQTEYFEPFVAARTQLVATLGMGGYARLMDAFASAERQLNRAWSAAADQVLDEAERCLAEGVRRLEATVPLIER